MENPEEFLIRESGTHYTIRLPVEGRDLVVLIDKNSFTVTIPLFEYMKVESIVKIIVQLYKNENFKNHPVIQNFIKFLQAPENEDELKLLQRVFRFR